MTRWGKNTATGEQVKKTSTPTGDVVLSATGLAAGYGGRAVVRDVDIEVRAGEVVALLGPNGAGKTTTLLTLAGELKPIGGTVSCLGGLGRASLHKRARSGLSFVTEDRSVFAGMSVADNLRVASVSPAAVQEYFPELGPLLGRRAGLLSGGEQQMLALGRALSRSPRLLLVDELSLGLAPLIVRRLLHAVRAAADLGVAVLLVEQHSKKALAVADRAYLMRRGQVVLEGTAAQLTQQMSDVEDMYLSGQNTST